MKAPVAVAAELGDIVELRRLLADMPIRANEEDDNGVVPLMFAAKGGSIAASRLLLDYGARLEATTSLGWSALLWAALSDQGNMVKWLIKQGAQIVEQDLLLSCFVGARKSVRVLLEYYPLHAAGFPIDCHGNTLLHLTLSGMCNLPRGCPERYLDCMDMLLQQGVPVDAVEPKHKRTCLQTFLRHRTWVAGSAEQSDIYMNAVKRLCAHSANVMAEDNEGTSALALAESSGLHQLHEVLLWTRFQFSMSRL
jgi:hypothetical protein